MSSECFHPLLAPYGKIFRAAIQGENDAELFGLCDGRRGFVTLRQTAKEKLARSKVDGRFNEWRIN